MRLTRLSLALVANLLPAVLVAQTGVVYGRVTDSTGAAVSRATITVDGAFGRTITNDRGDYELTGVTRGEQVIRVRAIGFLQAMARVTVRATDRTRQDFTLATQAISLMAMDVVVGSRGRHTAAEELAVPVDVYTAEDLAVQGTRETSQILQALSPSVNFPHQSVTDATDIVRPFTMRGLSPDHTLVLVNGWRRHQTAVVNTFAYGTGAGSSGVDLNTIPASAIERIEVLRDGASAQYGSDAIAGVVNIVTRDGPFAPFVSAEAGTYLVPNYPSDGRTVNLNGGFGFALGRGSLSLFGEVLDRQPTNRAWADPSETAGGTADVIDPATGKVITKNNPVPQPNSHWGDGLERDVMTMASLRLPVTTDPGGGELYAFGGYSNREGSGNGYRRYSDDDRNWPSIYPLGFLPEFHPRATDVSAAAGLRGNTSGWLYDLGASFGHSGFQYDLRNTLNTSLGPCLSTPCAPGNDGIFGNADDPGIPNQTSFMAGRLRRQEITAGINAARTLRLGLSQPVNVALGILVRRESWRSTQGERASWIDGGDTTVSGADAGGGSQVFAGIAPSDEANANRTNIGAYLDLESNLSSSLLGNVAARFENYSDFGSVFTWKAAVRLQASRRMTLRAAASTGFRAPGLGQINFSKVVTNVIAGVPEEIGVFPVTNPAAQLLGAKPLKQETSVNLSAGIAVTPQDNLTFTADVFRITITDRILLGATFDDDSVLAILGRNGFGTISGVQYFTNGLDTRTQGIDLTGELRASRFTFNAGVNYTRNQITRIDPLPAILQAPKSTETGLIDTVTYIGITEERPDWRATLQARYTAGRLRLLGRASYYGKFSSAQPGFCDLCRDRYGAKTLLDAEVGYTIGQLSLALGARNLLNTFPDKPSSTVDVGGGDTAAQYNNNFGIWPWAAASPFGYNGRFVYARAEVMLRR